MGCAPTATDPRPITIDIEEFRFLLGNPDAPRPLGLIRDAIKSAEAEVHARQDLRGGRAGSLRAARRLARRRLGTGPDPDRFGTPRVAPSSRAIRRRLARAR